MAERLFYVRGEIDVASAASLHATLDDAIAFNNADLMIDCSEVTLIDSSGLAVLVATQRDLRTTGRRLRIANATRATKRVIEVAGLTETLHVCETPAAPRQATG
jgi:anti-sigma B factor antagonist